MKSGIRWVGVLALVMSLGQAIAGEPAMTALPKMVDRAAEYGRQAAFVFDLDETLVDSSERRYESLLDVLAQVCAPEVSRHPDCDALQDLRLTDLYRLQNRYDIGAYLRHGGARDGAFIAELESRSFDVYLSGRYIVDKDHLFVGAQAFVKALKREGAEVYFVSSRSLERQERGTLEFLMARGLLRPGEEGNLYLKPDSERSPDFKRRATLEIADRVADQGGHVFGIFENEPENLAIWIENFPRARAFFVDVAYQHEGPVASKAVIVERDFRY